MSILLIGELSDAEYADWAAHLRSHLPKSEVLVLANDKYDRSAVDIALVANPPVGSLASLPNLCFIQSLWAGVDRLLCDHSVPQQVPIARLIDPSLTQAMVECAIGHVFHLHRQMPTYLTQQCERRWRQLPQPLASARSIGVLGLGSLGYAVAQALAALHFQLSGWSLHPRHAATIDAFHGAEGLARVARSSEILINLLPLTPQTTGILNGALFQQLPAGSALVNLGRGAHLVEQDLLHALSNNRPSHAVLDVFNSEPLPVDHPFWAHPQITVLPHIAAATDAASTARIVANNVEAFRIGGQITGLVSRSRGY